MDQKIEQLESLVEGLSNQIKTLSEVLSFALGKIDDNHLSFDKRFDSINSKLNIIGSQLDDLKGSSNHTIETLDVGFNDLKSEIQKINQVTGYIDLHENQSKFKRAN